MCKLQNSPGNAPQINIGKKELQQNFKCEWKYENQKEVSEMDRADILQAFKLSRKKFTYFALL